MHGLHRGRDPGHRLGLAADRAIGREQERRTDPFARSRERVGQGLAIPAAAPHP